MPDLPRWSKTFANDGGPLIALPRELLADWRGSDGPPVGDSDFGFDYWRACEAPLPANALDVGAGTGVVIGAQEGILTSNWCTLPDKRGVVLVGWEHAVKGVESIVEQRINEDSAWKRLSNGTTLTMGELVLIHAACPGDEVRKLAPFGDGYAVIGDALPFPVESGQYTIDYRELGGDSEPDSPFGCVAVRWIRVVGRSPIETHENGAQTSHV